MKHLEKLASLINKQPNTGVPSDVSRKIRAIARGRRGHDEFEQVLDAAPQLVQNMFLEHPELRDQCRALAEERLTTVLNVETVAHEHTKEQVITPLVAQYRGHLMNGLHTEADQLDNRIEMENNKLEEQFAKRKSIAMGAAIVALHGEVDRLNNIAVHHEADKAQREEQAYAKMTPHEVNLAILKELRARK